MQYDDPHFPGFGVERMRLYLRSERRVFWACLLPPFRLLPEAPAMTMIHLLSGLTHSHG